MLGELVALLSSIAKIHGSIGGRKSVGEFSDRLREVASDPVYSVRLMDALDRAEKAVTRLGKADVGIHSRDAAGDE